jgi:hypothetical protein
VVTETRTVREITLDLKKTISKLLDATKKAEQAERDIMVAIVELLNLQKEMERSALD